jgi:hypothetical protein
MAATPMYVSILTQITNFTRHHYYVFARVDIILNLFNNWVTLELFWYDVMVLDVTNIPSKFERTSK